MAGDVKRSLRVSARLTKELAWLLARSVHDPRVTSVTITRVEMPDDLRQARVYVRLLEGGEIDRRRKEALLGLSRAAGFLKKEVSQRMGLRVAPTLTFFYDDGHDQVSRVERLLDELKAEEFDKKRG